MSDAGCLRTEGIIALEEGLCRAVESGGAILRAEDAYQILASQERKGLHLQNRDSPWEAGIGDEVTGNQCSGDSLLCRGEPSWMSQNGVRCSDQTVPAVLERNESLL